MAGELKQQIKQKQPWDEPTRRTTSVEMIIDSNLLADEDLIMDAGIAEDSVVSIVFKPNLVICSSQDEIASLGGVINKDHYSNLYHCDGYDDQACQPLLAVEIPTGETSDPSKRLRRLPHIGQIVHPKLSHPHWG